MPKKKMSNAAFRAILIPFATLTATVATLATIGGGMFSPFFDENLGRGAKHITGVESAAVDYYGLNGTTLAAAKDESYQVSRQIQDEGTVLLKNNGVLPLSATTKLTPFGYRYYTPIYGQLTSSGSAKWTDSDVITPRDALNGVFGSNLNNEIFKKMKHSGIEPTSPDALPGTIPVASSSGMGNSNKILEFESAYYDEFLGAMPGSIGLVFVGRSGQEGGDKKYDGYDDGTPHYLALTANEKAAIRVAKEHCDKVVLILETSAAMELTPVMSGELECDAILQIGHTGERGFASLPDLLLGNVNPSGRTVDTWASDFTRDPTYQNFGRMTYNNATFTKHTIGEPDSANGDGTYKRYFYEYEEGVYVGYRYYETADTMDNTFVYGELNGRGGVTTPGAVNYPFGYGLSYTNFSQEISDYNDAGEDITVKVKVKNTGERAGKDVVQLYYSAPYTAYDQANKIEKSTVNLASFAKTSLLGVGEEEVMTLTFVKESMASYAYRHVNSDGTLGAYLLEAGDYGISLRKNSHTAIESRTWNNNATITYDAANPRQSEKDGQVIRDDEGKATKEYRNDTLTAASNRFQSSSDYMQSEATLLSRSDWSGTFPSMPTNRTKSISDTFKALFGLEETFAVATDPNFGNVVGSKAYHAENPTYAAGSLTLSDMRGLDYDDPAWVNYLNQVNYSDSSTIGEIVSLMTGAAYLTSAITPLGMPEANHCDGVNGIKNSRLNTGGLGDTATYGMAPLIASTWNEALVKEMGKAVGKEAALCNISGWYAPAINIHRSPFSGRVFEYYSEDPLLSGKIASSVISGAGEEGMYSYVKHFFLNDQETSREYWVHTWADEQTMREIYLKAFEIPFKEATMTVRTLDGDTGKLVASLKRAATAVMCSQNDIGPLVANANSSVTTDILRNEWGFRGTVHSDMFMYTKQHNGMFDLSFRSGLDTFLTYSSMAGIDDTSSPSSHWAMRRSLHDCAYTIANSVVLNGVSRGEVVYYDISPWKIWLATADVALYGTTAGFALWIFLRTLREKKHPENFKNKKRDRAA